MSRLTDSDKAWLLSFESGRNFYNEKMKNSVVTEKTYTRWLKLYSDALGKNPDELLLLKPNVVEVAMMIQKGITAINPNEADRVLTEYLSNDELTPSNKLVILTTVKSFYSANLRDLAKVTGKSIEAPERKQRTPTVDDCTKLESQMTNARNIFLLWFLESCPTRVGTLKQLTWKDLKPLNDAQVPYWIYVKADRLKGHGKGRYKKAKHIGFLHSYAVQKLEDYKKELERMGIKYNENSPIFMAYHKNPHGSKKGSKMVNFNDAFTDASILAFGDDIKKHFSPHDFRDIISTVLENPKVKATPNLARPLVSHKPSGIEASYANHQNEEDKPNAELLELFKMCLPFLIPETVGELKAELDEQKAETAKKLKVDNEQLTNLSYENIDLKGKLNNLSTRQETTEKELAFLKDYAFNVVGVIESKEDLEKLQGFMEKMRKEKEEKNTLPADQDVDESTATKPDFEKNARDELERQRKAKQK